MRPAVFLDRDGVINENRSDYVKSWQEFVFLPNVFEPLRYLAQSSYIVVVVTNQSAIGRGLVSAAIVEEIHCRMQTEIQHNGGRIDAIYYCPHHPNEGCSCRKPKPGLLLRAAQDLNIDLERSYFVGDAVSDVEAAMNAGCRPVFVLTGRGKEQLSLLYQNGYKNVPVFPGLREAVLFILSHQYGNSL